MAMAANFGCVTSQRSGDAGLVVDEYIYRISHTGPITAGLSYMLGLYKLCIIHKTSLCQKYWR